MQTFLIALAFSTISLCAGYQLAHRDTEQVLFCSEWNPISADFVCLELTNREIIRLDD